MLSESDLTAKTSRLPEPRDQAEVDDILCKHFERVSIIFVPASLLHHYSTVNHEYERAAFRF